MTPERHKKYLEDLSDVLRTTSGRRVVWTLLQHCGIYATSFTGNSGTFFNEGRRSVGLKLLRDTQYHPELFLKMQAECSKLEDFEIRGADGKEEKELFDD